MNAVLHDICWILPELCLILGLIIVFVVGLKKSNPWLFMGIAKPFVLASVFLVFVKPDSDGTSWVFSFHLENLGSQLIFANSLAVDSWARVFKILIYLAALFPLWFGLRSKEISKTYHLEFVSLILASIIGMSFLVGASDLLVIYISMEMVSLFSYVLASFRKSNVLSNEAGIKYMLFGAFASGTMLYGMSLLFGLTGSLNLGDISSHLVDISGTPPLLLLSCVLIFAGFAYKISAVPLHMWTPDVYEGAPTPVSSFFSVVPKIAGFAVLIRFFLTALSQPLPDIAGQWSVLSPGIWPFWVAVVSALTMTVGNLAALSQSNLKRLLAYSTIAHSGYILMGFVVLKDVGLSAIVYYLFVYAFMKLGAFYVVICVEEKSPHIVPLNAQIQNFKGLAWKSPLLGVVMAIFLFSLIGVPPTGGFFGKFYLFKVALESGFFWLVLVALLNTVVSLYYYAKILKAMFFEKPVSGSQNSAPAFSLAWDQSYILVFLSAGVMIFGVFAEFFVQWFKVVIF
ncbi:MAG: NADH-quinone oxidoreductase subunit N [Deltaproteobacteria bacterium]|nr:NADH-quinone oxidoreductase subunit N [Deltaproteobacteria bacterium]